LEEAVEVSTQQSRYTLDRISATFHGRDVFAPIAAHLSNGVALKRVGSRIDLKQVQNAFVRSRSDRGSCVLHLDRFGNIITNVRIDEQRTAERIVKGVRIERQLVDAWTRTFAAAKEGHPSLIVGSSGLLEIILKNSSAARELGASLDSPVEVLWR
jgi:S-adenosylmethionine hydrolase